MSSDITSVPSFSVTPTLMQAPTSTQPGFLAGLQKMIQEKPELFAYVLDSLGSKVAPKNPFAGLGTALARSSLAQKAYENMMLDLQPKTEVNNAAKTQQVSALGDVTSMKLEDLIKALQARQGMDKMIAW